MFSYKINWATESLKEIHEDNSYGYVDDLFNLKTSLNSTNFLIFQNSSVESERQSLEPLKKKHYPNIKLVFIIFQKGNTFSFFLKLIFAKFEKNNQYYKNNYLWLRLVEIRCFLNNPK